LSAHIFGCSNAAVALARALVMKKLPTFGQNGSGTKYHCNEIISYLNLFIPGKLMGFLTKKKEMKKNLCCALMLVLWFQIQDGNDLGSVLCLQALAVTWMK